MNARKSGKAASSHQRKAAIVVAAPATPKRPRPKQVVCAGRPPRLSGGKMTKRESTLFSTWFQRRRETDISELKLTDWSDIGSPRKGGIRSIGDIFMMMAGLSWAHGGREVHWGGVFHALAAELEVMAEAEMGKRGERQKCSQLSAGATDDLYGPLVHLAQRIHAMGEIMPRIIDANYVWRQESEAAQ